MEGESREPAARARAIPSGGGEGGRLGDFWKGRKDHRSRPIASTFHLG